MKNKNGITKFSILVVLIATNILASVGVFGDNDSERQNKITIKVNGEHTISFDKTIDPFLYKGRLFVPINVLSNDLNYSVKWNSTFDGATLYNNEKIVEIVSGTNVVKINGEETVLEESNEKIFPILKYERIFVPIRFVVEEFGGEVSYSYDEYEDYSVFAVDINIDIDEVEEIEGRNEERKNEESDSNKKEGVFTSIGNFFKSLWDSLLSLFS